METEAKGWSVPTCSQEEPWRWKGEGDGSGASGTTLASSFEVPKPAQEVSRMV